MAESKKPSPVATANRSTTPSSEAFKAYISTGWKQTEDRLPTRREQAPLAAARRARISELHRGKRLIVPAGTAKVRSNDITYPFRAHSAFAHLTGWGSDSVAGSVLVMEPTSDGHEAFLYFRESAGRDSDEFYANPAIGEFWVGPRPSLDYVAGDLGITTRGIAELRSMLSLVDAHTVIVRDGDQDLTEEVDSRRGRAGIDGDAQFARDLSELRLIKDSYEIAQMRLAIAATRKGFDDVIAELGMIITHPRGERLVEGTFSRRARAEGNATGYNSIAAAGAHACFLHWRPNNGPVLPGELILLDAGVELESYFTADITRTLPINGRFSPVQRLVYEAVLEAADAAFAIVRPGIRFRDIHEAALEVVARKTAGWGMLPVSVEESIKPENQYHCRYMVHGTSHHLGIDVHDCAEARRELYLDGIVEAGMVFTIEPGLYFQLDDLTVPEEFRGIGVRIEDDILVTSTGAENLSIGIPRTPDDVEAWLRS